MRLYCVRWIGMLALLFGLSVFGQTDPAPKPKQPSARQITNMLQAFVNDPNRQDLKIDAWLKNPSEFYAIYYRPGGPKGKARKLYGMLYQLPEARGKTSSWLQHNEPKYPSGYAPSYTVRTHTDRNGNTVMGPVTSEQQEVLRSGVVGPWDLKGLSVQIDFSFAVKLQPIPARKRGEATVVSIKRKGRVHRFRVSYLG